MENGNRQPLGEVRGKTGRVRFFGVGGKAEQVVYDDLDRASDVITGDAGEVEGFGPDALAGEGRIAMQDHGQNGAFAVFPSTLLAGTGTAHHHGIDRFEMAWV